MQSKSLGVKIVQLRNIWRLAIVWDDQSDSFDNTLYLVEYIDIICEGGVRITT